MQEEHKLEPHYVRGEEKNAFLAAGMQLLLQPRTISDEILVYQF